MKWKITFLILIVNLSCDSKPDQNFKDLQKVEIGMTLYETSSIMRNQPKSKETAYWNKDLYVHYYDSGFGASDDFMIVYSKKDSLVVEIGYGD